MVFFFWFFTKTVSRCLYNSVFLGAIMCFSHSQNSPLRHRDVDSSRCKTQQESLRNLHERGHGTAAVLCRQGYKIQSFPSVDTDNYLFSIDNNFTFLCFTKKFLTCKFMHTWRFSVFNVGLKPTFKVNLSPRLYLWLYMSQTFHFRAS